MKHITLLVTCLLFALTAACGPITISIGAPPAPSVATPSLEPAPVNTATPEPIPLATPTLESPTTAPPTATATATAVVLPTLSGNIGYLSFPSPASVLYVVNINDPLSWYTLDLPASDGLLSFSVQVPPGTYRLIAYTQDGSLVAAVRTADMNIAITSVGQGQSVVGLMLAPIAPQTPCQMIAVPASPDGRFPAIEADSACLSATPTATAAVTGSLPARPGSLNFTYVCSFASTTTTLNWIDSSNNETGFRLYRNDVLIATFPANVTSYVDITPAYSGFTLNYRLVAYNALGESAARTATYTCP